MPMFVGVRWVSRFIEIPVLALSRKWSQVLRSSSSTCDSVNCSTCDSVNCCRLGPAGVIRAYSHPKKWRLRGIT
jgi:hypothetical protein